MDKRLIIKIIKKVSYHVDNIDTWFGFYQPKKPSMFSKTTRRDQNEKSL